MLNVSDPGSFCGGADLAFTPLALIIHGTSGWLVSMDGLGCQEPVNNRG